jgi:DNA-binding transcriptional LysR family regulator
MKSADLGLLRALDALLATGSVTLAAERLHLSTPAMSHTLARIREMLGDPLLVRAGRKLVPTPRAFALREPVAQLLAQADALLLPGPGASLQGVQRRFVLTAPEGIPLVYGAALAAALAEAMPQASLYFLPEGQGEAEALRACSIDLAIGAFVRHPPEAEVVALSQQALVGAARAGHPLARGKVTVARYAAARHVAVALRPGESSALDDALAAAGAQRFVAVSAPSAHSALFIAARSDLVATVPQRTARSMQAGLGLSIFALPVPAAARPLLMAWHPRHQADPAHRWLRECVERILRQQARRATSR